MCAMREEGEIIKIVIQRQQNEWLAFWRWLTLTELRSGIISKTLKLKKLSSPNPFKTSLNDLEAATTNVLHEY